jgi:hypothetical protein
MRVRSSLSVVSLLVSLGAIACGSDATGPGAPDKNNEDPEDPDKVVVKPEGCGLSTMWEGDSQCLVPPDPEKGMQLHMGPQDYDDPDEINALGPDGKPIWLMMPGDERTQNYHLYSPNEVPIYYFEQHYRMRPGSHHMIITISDDKEKPEGFTNGFGNIINAIGGTQHISEDVPPNGVVAEEDQGLARMIEPHQAFDVQLHFYNVTENVRLREAWVNLMFKPKDEVVDNLGMLGGFTRMNVAPHTTATVGGNCDAENFIPTAESVRVVILFGHAHTHNTRFAVYHDKTSGEQELVYDSYDGAEAPTYMYNTQVQNPVPDAANRKSGSKSGMLTLAPGERLRYVCDINNDTDYTFHGANEVQTDEMCNLFGSVQGLGFPCFKLNR